MRSFVNQLEMYADGIKAIGVFLSVVWIFLIVLEWTHSIQYYHVYHIEHSFRPSYKIVFTPRYAVSVLYSMLLVSVIQTLYFLEPAIWGALVASVVIVIKEAIQRKRQHNILEKCLKRSDPCVIAFRKASANSSNHDYGLKASVAILLTIVLCFVANKASSMVLDCIKYLPHIFWSVIVCIIVHYYINDLSGSYNSRVNSIRYLRLIQVNDKHYSIIAPLGVDNNAVCVAVRTVICKRKNQLIYGFLILDDSVTMEAPYNGGSFLISVDCLSSVWPDNYISALCSDGELREIVTDTDTNFIFYLDGKEWKPIDDLGKSIITQ